MVLMVIINFCVPLVVPKHKLYNSYNIKINNKSQENHFIHLVGICINLYASIRLLEE